MYLCAASVVAQLAQALVLGRPSSVAVVLSLVCAEVLGVVSAARLWVLPVPLWQWWGVVAV